MTDPMKMDDPALPKLATLNLIGAVYIPTAKEKAVVMPHRIAQTAGFITNPTCLTRYPIRARVVGGTRR